VKWFDVALKVYLSQPEVKSQALTDNTNSNDQCEAIFSSWVSFPLGMVLPSYGLLTRVKSHPCMQKAYTYKYISKSLLLYRGRKRDATEGRLFKLPME